MPLVAGLYAIVFDNQPLPAVIAKLMSAEQKSDVEFAAVMSTAPINREENS